MSNGAIVHKVRVTLGCYNKGGSRVLVFTKHDEDRYTVFGLTPIKNNGISIERRKHEEKVLRHFDGAQYTLGPDDLWIAYKYANNSYYGYIGVGATPEAAYKNCFGLHGFD